MMTDIFTQDGRLKPHPSVTKAKVAKVAELYGRAKNGDRVAGATLMETITTSDAIFSMAHLVNIETLPQFDKATRNWSSIATVRNVDDFNPVLLQSLYFNQLEGLERGGSVSGGAKNNPEGVLPVVPEGTPYPYAYVAAEESDYTMLNKRGAKVGWTWESRINDRGTNFLSNLPPLLLESALDTEEWLVWDALISGTASGSQLAGGTTYTGATVLPNATISRDAVVQAIFELSQREINGRKIVVTGGYNLIVPSGTEDAVRFVLQQALATVVDGSFSLNASFLSDGIAQTTVVGSEYVTGTNWYLMPKPGATRRPVIELLRLNGYTVPELRVNSVTGNYAGGAAVPPFEGSFDNDTIDFRVRYPVGNVNWNDDFIVWSQGDNVL